MAQATLQSFNVFLTERLTAAAVDIYGFVEKTMREYQEEVDRAQLENRRLQRLLDLVYKPEIRLHRTDSGQIDLPAPKQEVCAQEQQNQEECFPSEAQEEPVNLPLKEELTEPWFRSVVTPLCPAYSAVTDKLTQTATVEMPDNLTQVITVGEHVKYERPSQDDPPLPSSRVSPTHTKKNYKFSCNICYQSFPKKIELKLHRAAHTAKSLPNRGFSCSVCGRIRNTMSQMICHMRVHTGEKPFVCSICGKRYKVKGHLNEHLWTHTGERPFVCHVCGKCFGRPSNMSKHAKIKHRESMPFKCMHCSQFFPVLVLLKQHLKTVHNDTSLHRRLKPR